jgi:sigma-B regulation protein RsbU (phosphoserine phosphatase)
MQLAHDLQMKLLPNASVVAPEAEVAARVIPAESVGGDFYHLFKLGAGRTGVMIGDVSGHGYRAALIMALVMSATAIHAQAPSEPAETLHAVLSSLRDELMSTEMFVSAFYGIIDREQGFLRYANTGHPHAFVIAGDGTVERLYALDPPLGMVDDAPKEQTRPWKSGSDLLVLFTDGVAEARKRDEARAGEANVLDTVKRYRHEPASDIMDRVFDALESNIDARRDDLTLVLLRS